MNHKLGSFLFALLVGLGLAVYAYQRATDPLPRMQRAEEERIVLAARAEVKAAISPDADLEIVDALQTNRIAGKVYVYPTGNGWEVSGHYRRGDDDVWHPWLMRLDTDGVMQSLAVRDTDPGLLRRAAADSRFSVDP